MQPDEREIDEEWLKILTVGHRPLKILHTIFNRLPSEPRCKLCHNPFGGIGGKLVRIFGYKPSRKNPNMCAQCCDATPRGGAEVDVAVLFADVRGSTAIAESMGASDYAALMNRFYIAATRSLIRHDAIIDKLIGDEVMALFIPGIAGPRYKRKAADAAVDLVKAVGYDSGQPWLPIGVGIHSGIAYVGNVGPEDMTDFTALGDPVNTAARLQGAAGGGEVAMTGVVYSEVRDQFPRAEARIVALRGRAESVQLHIIRVDQPIS